MDLYELRLDQPHPGTRDGDPGHGRVCQLPQAPRARAGRAPGAVAGTASRDESSMSDRARAQVTTPEALPDERLTDAALRPSRLDEFVGQAKVKESLQIAIDAAKQRHDPLDHTLFFGPPGLGKTTLALLMAKELGVNIRTTSGPVLERPGDLVGLLTSLRAGDILFIDEVHRWRPALEEFPYPAMEEYRVDVRVVDGSHAQTIPMTLERFTLIGATTRFGLLTPPMRARFGLIERLHYYPPDDIAQILTRSARILTVPTDPAGTAEIARRSRGTPRVANRLLKRVRDYAQVRADFRVLTSFMRASDFEYELPPDRIAQDPLADRAASRLLVLERSSGAIRHAVFRDIVDLIGPEDVLVVNASRVIAARLRGRRD